MTFRSKTALVAISAMAFLALALPAGSFAGGGKSIATATPVVIGQLQSGNTAEGSELGDCGNYHYRSYWALNVTAGDVVKIPWQGGTTNINKVGTRLSVYAIGTTDYNVGKEGEGQPVAEQELGFTGKNKLTFTASLTGTMPLEFSHCGSTPGPYDFAVYVTPRNTTPPPNTNPSSLYVSPSYARNMAAKAVKAYAGRKGKVSSCTRLGSAKFRCKVGWKTPKYRYRAVVKVTLVREDYLTYAFSNIKKSRR